jgi:hypothetical protein
VTSRLGTEYRRAFFTVYGNIEKLFLTVYGTVPAYPGVDVVLLFEAVDGDWEGGGAGGCTKGRHQRVTHVRHKPDTSFN